MTVMMRLRPSLTLALVLATAMVLGACSDGAETPRSDAAEGPAEAVAGPVRISVLTVQPRQVVVYDELPGRVSARRTAEIRPQVSGIVRSVMFTEGTEVSADQPLFQIDPAPFAADVEAASAVLARAEADLVNAKVKHGRIEALAAAQTASAGRVGSR